MTPEQQLCEHADKLRHLIDTPDWQLFVALCHQRRDQFIASRATKTTDPVFIADYAFAVNDLTNLPYGVISRADALIEEHNQRLQGTINKSQSGDEAQAPIRPPPQPV